MDHDAYRRAHFADPQPEPRFDFAGIHGVTLFYADYDAAIAFYSEVLGPPGYAEGEGTRGWRVGDTWLTLLRGSGGNPVGVEVPVVMASPEEADRLQAAFVAAGAAGRRVGRPDVRPGAQLPGARPLRRRAPHLQPS